MKLAYMFSGQGAQYPGMGKELYDRFDCCREIYRQADEALGFSITKVCFEGSDGTGGDIHQTEYTQPAILTTSMAVYSLVRQYQPDYVMGLSLGEYAALTAAGALNFSDAVALVRKRGRYMMEACPDGVGVMSAIMHLGREVVEEICLEAASKGIVSPANYNMPGQVVIAGEAAAVAEAERLAVEKGARKCIRLNVSGAFHTRLLESASVRLEEELKKIEISDMKTPVITNLTGRTISRKEEILSTLVRQVMSPVLWEDGVRYAIEQGVETFIELGPGKTLSSFVKKINKEVQIMNIEDVKSYESVMQCLQ